MNFKSILGLSEWVYPQTMVSEQDLNILYEAALRLNAKVILELGTGFGHSTVVLGYAAKQVGGRVFSMDIRDQNKMRPVLSILPIELIMSDDMKFTWEREIDLLFIDTSHEYVHTLAELNKYMPWVKGECFMHDVTHPAHAYDEFNAIEKFLKTEVGKQWKYMTYETHLNGDPLGMGRFYK